MSKVKMLLDVVDEVKKEAPQDVPNWTSKLAEAFDKNCRGGPQNSNASSVFFE